MKVGRTARQLEHSTDFNRRDRLLVTAANFTRFTRTIDPVEGINNVNKYSVGQRTQITVYQVTKRNVG